MDWYYIDSSKPEGKRRNGPWSLRQMLGFAEQGAFATETLVWRDGFDGWKPWSAVEPELKGELQAETIKQVIEEKVLPNITVNKACYAGFWVRLCAYVIDFVLLQLIFTLLTPIHSHLATISQEEIIKLLEQQITLTELTFKFMPLVLFSFGIIFIYNSFFVKNFSGTPGKIALGLAVVRQNGKPMTWSCAFLRSFASFFSSLFFGVGYLLAAFDIEKRALHDFMANTRVLKLQRA